mmetsp:Transcript_12486/g.35068  ORF Transcript_12486/g.35068 Transcript_12486/m.35068 type:complete len:269 (+) Transcript_12486:600-1406(+)
MPMALMLPAATWSARRSRAPGSWAIICLVSSVDARLYRALTAVSLAMRSCSASRATSEGTAAPLLHSFVLTSGDHARLVMAAAAAWRAPRGPLESVLSRASSPPHSMMSDLCWSYRLRFIMALAAASWQPWCSLLRRLQSASMPCSKMMSSLDGPSHARFARAPAAAADTFSAPVLNSSTSFGMAPSATTMSLTAGLQTKLAIALEAEALAESVPSSRKLTMGGTPPEFPMTRRRWLLRARLVSALMATSRSVPPGSFIIDITVAVPF